MKAMISRSLKLFLRDKAAVFFSLLTVLIVIALYVLFLSKEHVEQIQRLAEGVDENDISWLVNCWILGGMMSIIPVTSCCGVLATMMRDQETKIIKDFKSTPLRKSEYPLAMIISSAIVGFLMSVCAFVIYVIYIYASWGHMFSAQQILKTLGLTAFTAVLGASSMGFLVSLLKSMSAYSSFCIVVDTLIGFLNGVYVPIGALPKGVQTVTKIVPFNGAASLFRSVLVSDSIQAVFAGAPEEAILDYRAYEGIDFIINGKAASFGLVMLYMGAIAVITFILFMIRFASKKKEY